MLLRYFFVVYATHSKKILQSGDNIIFKDIYVRVNILVMYGGVEMRYSYTSCVLFLFISVQVMRFFSSSVEG
jgi:hypothetical protein